MLNALFYLLPVFVLVWASQGSWEWGLCQGKGLTGENHHTCRVFSSLGLFSFISVLDKITHSSSSGSVSFSQDCCPLKRDFSRLFLSTTLLPVVSFYFKLVELKVEFGPVCESCTWQASRAALTKGSSNCSASSLIGGCSYNSPCAEFLLPLPVTGKSNLTTAGLLLDCHCWLI